MYVAKLYIQLRQQRCADVRMARQNKFKKSRKDDTRAAETVAVVGRNGVSDARSPVPLKAAGNKRPRDEQSSHPAVEGPAKRLKVSHAHLLPNPSALKRATATPTNDLRLLNAELEKTYNVRHTTVLSSNKLSKRIRQTLEHINVASEERPLAVLSAKAPVTAKLISIVEIVKRQSTDGKVYQYSTVTSVIVDKESLNKERKKRLCPKEGVGLAANEEGDDKTVDVEEEDDAFETMKHPGHLHTWDPTETKKIRAVPLLTVYLARHPIPELKKALGSVIYTSRPIWFLGKRFANAVTNPVLRRLHEGSWRDIRTCDAVSHTTTTLMLSHSKFHALQHVGVEQRQWGVHRMRAARESAETHTYTHTHTHKGKPRARHEAYFSYFGGEQSLESSLLPRCRFLAGLPAWHQ